MIVVVFTACMIAAPAECETHAVALTPDATELTCLNQIMPTLAQQLRPGWKVERAGCTREET